MRCPWQSPAFSQTQKEAPLKAAALTFASVSTLFSREVWLKFHVTTLSVSDIILGTDRADHLKEHGSPMRLRELRFG